MGGVREWSREAWRHAFRLDPQTIREAEMDDDGSIECTMGEVAEERASGVITEHPTLERFMTKLASRTSPLKLSATETDILYGKRICRFHEFHIQPQDLLALIQEVMATPVEEP